MALHTTPKLAEMEPVAGVYFAAKKPHLDQLVLTEEPSYKLFVGHSGWAAGQLENEMRKAPGGPCPPRRNMSSRPTIRSGKPSSASWGIRS